MSRDRHAPTGTHAIQWAKAGAKLLRSLADQETDRHLQAHLYAAASAVRDCVTECELRQQISDLRESGTALVSTLRNPPTG